MVHNKRLQRYRNTRPFMVHHPRLQGSREWGSFMVRIEAVQSMGLKRSQLVWHIGLQGRRERGQVLVPFGPMQGHRVEGQKLVPLRALFSLSVLVLVFVATPSTAAQTNVDDLLGHAKRAIQASDNSAAALHLQKALSLSTSAAHFDRVSRAFEKIGWYRDARIASERVANLSNADPHLRAIHANRSRSLQPKVEKAFVRVTHSDPWSMVWVNGSLVKASAPEVEVDPSDGAVVVEVLSIDGRDLAVFWIEAKTSRRMDLKVPDPNSKESTIYLTEECLKLTLKEYEVKSSLLKLRRLHLAPGRVPIKVSIDEKAPVTLELQGQPGQQVVLKKDIDAATTLRDLKVTKEMSIRSQVGPYITMATGALIGGVGLAFYGAAQNDRNRSAAAAKLSSDEVESLALSAQNKEGTGGLLLGLGVTATVSGVVWYIINLARGRKEANEVEFPSGPPSQPSTAILRF
jgi:hypothetical protein